MNRLFVSVLLRDHGDLVRNKVHGVEPNAKLANEVQVPALGELLEELFRCELQEQAAALDVPDLAIVPRLLIKSSLDMPMPRSRIERVFSSLFASIYESELTRHVRTKISSCAESPSPRTDESVRERKRILSRA